MKGDVYYLLDSDGRIQAKFEQNDDFMSGNCYECVGWYDEKKDGSYDTPCDWHFFAHVFCKWDACTHWHFFGEDYDSKKENPDSYYHICGASCFTRLVTMMCFLWKLSPMIINECDKETTDYTNEEYYETDEIKRLIETMLDGYTIVKGGAE